MEFIPLFQNASFGLWVFVVLVIFMAGLSKGGLGAGLVVAAVPLLSFVLHPTQAAALMLPLLCCMDLVSLKLYWRLWNPRAVRLLMPGALMGIGLGTWAFFAVSVPGLQLMLGLISLAACLQQLMRKINRQQSPGVRSVQSMRIGSKLDAFLGFLSGLGCGFSSHIAHAGGPAFDAYMLPKRLPKLEFVGTATLVFALINFTKVIPYAASGQFSLPLFMTILVLTPVAMLGVFAGRWLVPFISDRHFYLWVYGLLFLVGLKLIFNGLTGLSA